MVSAMGIAALHPSYAGYHAMREFIADPKGFVEVAILEVDLGERDSGV
jgi:hypothetical protein